MIERIEELRVEPEGDPLMNLEALRDVQLTVSVDGFAPTVSDPTAVGVGRTVTLNFTLKVGSASINISRLALRLLGSNQIALADSAAATRFVPMM
jgi:hypothetical protein